MTPRDFEARLYSEEEFEVDGDELPFELLVGEDSMPITKYESLK